MNRSWQCPYCNSHQIFSEENLHSTFQVLEVGDTEYGVVGITLVALRCVRVDCNRLKLDVYLDNTNLDHWSQTYSSKEHIRYWAILPDSKAKPQPDYIPKSIRDDYVEACLIVDRSPKASATLLRRCLQGMIRDFCGISKGRLFDEIASLRKLLDEGKAPHGVQHETLDAIDAVRGVGNIGAHMEKDISVIVDVEPGEAEALIQLIEMLFDEWYVARHERQARLKRVQEIAEGKKKIIDQHKTNTNLQGTPNPSTPTE